MNLKDVFVKVNHHNLTALFLCSLEACCHTSFSHNALAIAQFSVDGVLWILVAKRHRVGIDDDADFCKGMEYGASSTDIALQFSWVSVHTDKQTLAIDFILDRERCPQESCADRRSDETTRLRRKGDLQDNGARA